MSKSANLMPDSEGSTVLLHHPLRACNTNGAMMSFQSIPFIPTKYFGDILEKARARTSNERTLQLLSTPSSHSLTRTGVGWIFEQNMLRAALRISNASHHMLMHPPTHLLPGTMAGLQSPGVLDSFYWLQLSKYRRRTTGNIFALQMTIADDHECPDQGPTEIWKVIPSTIRSGRTWHVVRKSDKEMMGRTFWKDFLNGLEHFRLGRENVTVQVWYCVLLSVRSVRDHS
ncbi:MAG: hypothetical protein NXY57DRAFT_1021270 [Lentinula lateritia]|nr:MAG: hypothetical protein NXY57DRAFT_1021270 [Lentinula lateritia]